MGNIEVFSEYLDHIEDPMHRERTEEVLSWVMRRFPNLKPELKWNQPMFTDHGTFIIAFSISKKHLAVSPEQAGIARFTDEISKIGYDQTKNIVRIPWDRPVEFTLLEKMIEYNIMDKANCTTFWRN